MGKDKKWLIFLLTLILSICIVSDTVLAEGNSYNDAQIVDEDLGIGELGGYLQGNYATVKNLADEEIFTTNASKNSHGFAAEKGNNLIDVLKGYRAKVVGGDNAKNGADRTVTRNGVTTYIQDKYYSTAGESVSAAFDENGYRYVYDDGKPMQLEVPSDQYKKAVEAMAKKIEEGKVRGVSDPAEAKNIVRKGHLTYKQAVNLTKAGTVESLTYDSANGVIAASGAVGISFALDYAMCKLNGQTNKEAMKNASLTGLKTGGVVFATYVISSQLMKTGLPEAMTPIAKNVANSLGKELSKSLLKTYGVEAAALTSEQIQTQIIKILQSQIITAGVLIVVLSIDDVIDLFQGRISKEQLLKNLVVTIVSVGASVIGSIAGGAAGTAVLPGVGTTAGAIAGGVVGGTVAGLASSAIMSRFKDDSDEMYDIIVAEFQNMCDDYLISQDEADTLTNTLRDKLTGELLKDMYQSDDREKFANNLMKPMFEAKVSEREKIKMPSEDEIRSSYVSLLEGIVFIH